MPPSTATPSGVVVGADVAEVVPTLLAVAALVTDAAVGVGGDGLADGPSLHARAEGHDFPGELVSGDDVGLEQVGEFRGVQVRATDPAGVGADEHLPGAGRGIVDRDGLVLASALRMTAFMGGWTSLRLGGAQRLTTGGGRAG